MILGSFGLEFGILPMETIGLWIATEVAAMRTPIARRNWVESAEVIGRECLMWNGNGGEKMGNVWFN